MSGTATKGHLSAISLEHINLMLSDLAPMPLSQVIEDAGGAENVVYLIINMINGFCKEGVLASERANNIIHPISNAIISAGSAGVTNFVLLQDSHSPNAVEFKSFLPHCIKNSVEAETVRELMELPMSRNYTVITMNSTHPFINTGMETWIKLHPNATHFILFGVSVDMAIYQAATWLKFSANARDDEKRTVIVPVNGVQTIRYDDDEESEVSCDVLHSIFLYHLKLNGITLVKSVI